MNKSSAKILKISLLVLMVCVIFSFTGCGKEVSITVKDANITTEVTAKTNMKVSDILSQAGILLGEKDECVPAANEKLRDAAEIVVKRYAKVTVKNGDIEKTVELVGATVSEAVKEAGFTTDENIKVDVDENSFLEDGMIITLKNSIEVTLKADGETKKVKTHADTVEEFLSEQKITLDEDDTVSPASDSKIEEGTKITVKRIEYKEETKKEKIKYKTKETVSSSMKAGTSKVTRVGKNCEKEVTYKVKYVDGKEKSRKVINEKIIKEPVAKLVTVGTAVVNSKTVVSKQPVYNCDGSGHGYYVIKYSDGSVEYKEF